MRQSYLRPARPGQLPSCLGALAAIVIALVIAPTRPAFAIGEQVGRIRGTLIEAETKKPLIGATVTATSPALLGPPRVTQTDGRGRYDLVNLPAGEYRVVFSFEGLAPIERTVRVNVSEVTPLNLSWSFTASGVEGVNVVERRKLTRPDSTSTGSVIQTRVLKKLPTARSYQDAAQKVSGVSGGANPNVKGGFSRHNRYLVDGLDVTDPVTGTFSLNMPFDSMSAIDVQTGGLEAQYNSMGGLINIITKGGANTFAGEAAVYYNHSSLSETGESGSQLYEGRQPFRETPSGPNQSQQLSLNIGGPLLSDRLWFRFTYDLRRRTVSPPKLAPLGVAPYDVQHPPLRGTSHLISTRLSYSLSPRHVLWLSNTFSPGSFDNFDGGNVKLGIAENHQNQNSIFNVLGWDFLINDNVTTNVQAGILYQLIEFGPQGWLGDVDQAGCRPGERLAGTAVCKYDRNNARHTNQTDNTVWYQGDAYQNDIRYKVQLDPSVSIRASAFGKHDIKVGVQGVYNYRTRDIKFPGRLDPNKPVGSSYTDAPNRNLPLETGLCDPMDPDPTKCYRRTDNDDVYMTEKAYGIGFFLQDRWWTPLEWLTVVPGLRVDYGATYGSEKEEKPGGAKKRQQVTSMWTPGLGADWLKIAPRLGVTANLTADGRNVAFAYYGRNTETLSLLAASFIDGSDGSLETVYQFNPVSKTFEFYSKSGGPGGSVVDHDAKTPHSDEVTLGYRREIFTDSLASVEYTYKRFSNMWASVEINRIWDPSGSRVIGFRDPEKPDLDVFEYTTPDENHRTYQGFTFTSEGDPSPNWTYVASYNLSWTYGPAISLFGANAFDNPRQAKFYGGFNPEDLRHYFRIYAAHDFSHHLSAGFAFAYQSGLPATKLHFNAYEGGNFNRRSPNGTAPGAPNDLEKVSELRSPDQVDLDLRITANLFPKGNLGNLLLSFDFFNVLDLRTPTSISSADNVRFGQVGGRKAPRRLQLSLTYEY